MRAGCQVRVCLTDAAAEFVRPALFEALTGEPCLSSAFEEPEVGKMAHIDLARWAEVVVVAPATANTLNKLAAGIGDDMLTTLALATTAPVVLAPAMNPTMWKTDSVLASMATLRSRAATVVEPDSGDVACGENGQGKLASIDRILAAVLTILSTTRLLAGKRVLITSGPTQEPIDAARYVTNRSSGKMGAALARAALLMGAEVTVVTGPAAAPLPGQAAVHRVRTAQEMLAAAQPLAPQADLILGAAAVADYRPAAPSAGKIRRSDAELQLSLVPNPDIIAALTKAAQPKARVIAFAAEPTGDLQIAREKLAKKGVYAIVANDISGANTGFESDTNQLTLITASQEEQSAVQSKLECALWLLERVGRDLG